MSTQSDTAQELYEEEMQALASAEQEQERLEEAREHSLRVLGFIWLAAEADREDWLACHQAHRLYLTWPELMPNPYISSPWEVLYQVQEDWAFITTMGLNVRTFHKLLEHGFQQVWDSTSISQKDTSPFCLVIGCSWSTGSGSALPQLYNAWDFPTTDLCSHTHHCLMLSWLLTRHSACCLIVTVVTPSQLRYSCNSGNVPGLHIILQVELLTPFTSRLPFLLCSSFVLTLLIRKHRLVVLSFCSIVLHSQTYLRSVTPNSLLCPLLVIVPVVPHNHLIIFPFCRYIHSHVYIYEQVMYDRIS